MPDEANPAFGTREWAVKSLNLILGCEHRCRYCYAAANAARFRMCQRDEWGTDRYYRVNTTGLKPFGRHYEGGRVMFPTSHDITPRWLDYCIQGITTALNAGNDLLIVSKPHLECIQTLCREFSSFKDRILFRFTIGAIESRILAYWEPGAPLFPERQASLQFAFRSGFQTSVSSEPMLDQPREVELFRRLEPFISDSFWIGKMDLRRVIAGTDPAEIRRIVEGQEDERIWELYQALREEPKIRWKDCCKRVLSIERLAAAGLDR